MDILLWTVVLKSHTRAETLAKEGGSRWTGECRAEEDWED